MNNCTFIGNLGTDPAVRYTASGEVVANFNLACTERWTKDGVRQEKTVWVRCVAFRKAGELIAKHTAKGHKLYVQGKLSTSSYEKAGVTIYTTEIVVDTFEFLTQKETKAPVAHVPAPEDQGVLV